MNQTKVKRYRVYWEIQQNAGFTKKEIKFYDTEEEAQQEVNRRIIDLEAEPSEEHGIILEDLEEDKIKVWRWEEETGVFQGI